MRAERLMKYPERTPTRMGDGRRIAVGLMVFLASGGVTVWLLLQDVEYQLSNYSAGSEQGNTAWVTGLVAVVALVYVLWIVFRDVEEVIEHEVREHRDDLRQLERFEPTLFRWLLAVVVLIVLVALLVS
jgi:Na+/H+ antiporter NhaD/arsenite permease-like protein